jgi:hypothetical protein
MQELNHPRSPPLIVPCKGGYRRRTSRTTPSRNGRASSASAWIMILWFSGWSRTEHGDGGRDPSKRKFPRGGEFDTLGEGKGRGGSMRWQGRWCLSQRRGKSSWSRMSASESRLHGSVATFDLTVRELRMLSRKESMGGTYLGG